MKHWMVAWVVGLLVCVLTGPAIAAGSVIGEWKLVEQTYGEGKSNLVAADDPAVRLQFFRQGSAVQARIWAGGPDDPGQSWPRLVPDDARRVEVREKNFSPTEDRAVVRYRVAPSPGDDLVLEVTEEYRVVDDGGTLLGTVRVQFTRNGQDRGSYELHRRFERQP